MEQNHQEQPVNIPQASEGSGNVRNNAESFHNLPNGSESFGKIPHHSESFRSVPKVSERKESHTLTVREVARLFEDAGVARTERSIINWCQPNRMGISRLDCYFDPNERKYFITPQSVELAIAEERARAAKINESSEPAGNVPKDSEKPKNPPLANPDADTGRVRELEKENMDLKITNRAKDFFIEQLHKERGEILEQLMSSSRKVGELETKLLQLGAGSAEGKQS